MAFVATLAVSLTSLRSFYSPQVRYNAEVCALSLSPCPVTFNLTRVYKQIDQRTRTQRKKAVREDLARDKPHKWISLKAEALKFNTSVFKNEHVIKAMQGY